MNNILLDAAKWSDGDYGSPPSYWNGTTYTYIGDVGTGKYYTGATMQYGGTVNTGDTVAGSITSTSADPTEFGLLVNGSSIFNVHLTNGQTYPFSHTLNAGDSVEIQLGVGDSLYSQDAVLTPSAIPVAPNETINCAEYSSNNSVTPSITQNGNLVTGSTLAIASPAGNGAATVNGANLLYTPNDGYFGPDSFTYTATYDGLVSNTATIDVTVTPAACDEIGRTTKAVASAYYRTRVQDCRLVMGEKRCLVADFNGVISSSRKVVSVVWKCDFGYVAQMSRARIQPDNRSVAVDILANWIGDSVLQCAATLDNGEVYMQMFRVDVSGDPIFMPAVSGNGPTVLTAP